jgi:hypothetical protein
MTRYELSEEANQAINDWISQIIDSTTTPTNNKLSDCTRGTRDNQRSDVSIPILSYRPQQLAILEREVSGERVLRKESLEEPENEALDDGEEEPATFAVKKKGRKSKGKKAKLYDPSSFKYDDISAQFEKMNEAIDKEQREAERILNAPRA